uniref:Ig-like domain-containing protein n=1 Tax=Spermophilus dauricus TaxID=99837 RepID=A0A8C9Q1Q8_SPEDA
VDMKKALILGALTLLANVSPCGGENIVEIPEVAVFLKSPVTLGIPNTLLCLVGNIFPPVINITWFCNGHLVPEGIAKTIFYPKSDHSFLKFSYLTFVEHLGLEEPLLKHWEPELPTPMSELTETVACALGLALGLMGVVIGTILIIHVLHSRGTSRLPPGVLTPLSS